MLAALVGGSLLFALLLGECALRVKAYFDDRELDIFQNLDGVNVVHDPAARVRLRNIIRLNDHPRSHGDPVYIGSDRGHPTRALEAERHVVGIGDPELVGQLG